MPAISPATMLLVCVLLTLAALAVAIADRRFRRSRLRRLARESGRELQVAAEPGLTRAIQAHLPALGAADVRLSDLLVEAGEPAPPEGRLTIARVDYALGTVRHRRDQTQILAIAQDGEGHVTRVESAPPEMSRIEQYRHLLALAPRTAESQRRNTTL